MQAALPQICFGTVYHARLRPVANAFRYRTFYLRLPLRAMAAQPAAARLFSRNRWNLLAFFDADHGDGQRPLLDWIDDLLRQEGIDDADGEIWLQTFPRVLGYVFNPVSFWFCHRRDGALRAILCEVNNTFGERHCYLLDSGGILEDGDELCARKVFHVSPFCAVAGEYRFRFMACERLVAGKLLQQHAAHIHLVDGGGPLLRTAIAGMAHVLTDRAAIKALLTYPLMTLAVVVQIHWQAARLWFKGVPFFRKPSPPQNELSR